MAGEELKIDLFLYCEEQRTNTNPEIDSPQGTPHKTRSDSRLDYGPGTAARVCDHRQCRSPNTQPSPEHWSYPARNIPAGKLKIERGHSPELFHIGQPTKLSGQNHPTDIATSIWRSTKIE
jgi:hypothetical protein